MTPLSRRRVTALAGAMALAPSPGVNAPSPGRPGTRHRQTLQLATGHTLEVWTLQGVRPGPRFLLTAGIHGDELNGIATVERVLTSLDPQALAGTVTAVPIINGPGHEARTRSFATMHGSVDLNRVFPGDATSTDAAGRYVAAVWAKLQATRPDFAVDVHTLTPGAAYPLFVFADFRVAAARRLATGLAPDLVKIDLGQPGSLETTLLRAGVPAVTLEVGGAGPVDDALVSRATRGITNALCRFGLLSGPVDAAAPFVGNATTTITAVVPGRVTEVVPLASAVTAGEVVARQGGRTYRAPRAGRVLATTTRDALAVGDLLVRLLYVDADPRCRSGC